MKPILDNNKSLHCSHHSPRPSGIQWDTQTQWWQYCR